MATRAPVFSNPDQDVVELDLRDPPSTDPSGNMMDAYDGGEEMSGPPTGCKRCFPTKGMRELARGLAIASAALGVVILVSSLVLTIRLARDPVIVLVSLDGVSFLQLMNQTDITPNLNRIREAGITARFLPSYPTKSWPNHYSIITGLYPEHHGIVANRFYDPPSRRIFDYTNPLTVDDAYFYNGKPFWSVVNAAGLKSACSQFPACSVPTSGGVPTYTVNKDASTPNFMRMTQVLDWIDFSADKQPSFIATYMSDVDDIAHMFGPNSVHIEQALRNVDTQLGILYDGIKSRSSRYDIDLIVVSDHGFGKIIGRIFIDDYVDVSNLLIPELEGGSTPQLAIWTQNVSSIMPALLSIPNTHVYLKEDMPDQWHYNESVRIAPVHVVADEGYLITTRDYYMARPNEFVGGNHGWDPYLPDMAGIFIGAGSSFLHNTTIPNLQNIELFNLMAAILDIKAAPDTDGTFPFQMGILDPSYQSNFLNN